MLFDMHVACLRGRHLNVARGLGVRRDTVRGLEGPMSKGWCHLASRARICPEIKREPREDFKQGGEG